ncbi:ATP synthase subunit I [Sporomusa sp.]|uniref:ATP synthase subunit I n=1 Tax=Sporomusa sp. TaxID=2078658 RepID=UPI002B9F7117|nr:ATP synthase subunit I [Sporomusa sp.]HWR42051.1 ATP synthase subunit I [Sporomusa sp.]
MAKAACMRNYELKVRTMLAQLALIGTILCPLAYIYSTVQTTTGLLIGLITGSIYFLYLYRQVENVQVLSKKQAIEHIRGGWVIRLGAMVLVLVVISHVLKVNVLAFVAGFFTMPVILFLNGMLLVVKQIADAKKT